MSGYQEIEVRRVKEMLDSGTANIVDIRDPGSYEMGHIPRSLHLTDANVKNFIQEADKNKPLIVCCYHGNSSREAAVYLAHQGFSEVYSLTGGFEAWRQVHPKQQ